MSLILLLLLPQSGFTCDNISLFIIFWRALIDCCIKSLLPPLFIGSAFYYISLYKLLLHSLNTLSLRCSHFSPKLTLLTQHSLFTRWLSRSPRLRHNPRTLNNSHHPNPPLCLPHTRLSHLPHPRRPPSRPLHPLITRTPSQQKQLLRPRNRRRWPPRPSPHPRPTRARHNPRPLPPLARKRD